MVTSFIKKFISSFIIQSFEYICRSDHCAMLMAIDIRHLIQLSTLHKNTNTRAIQSNTPKQIRIYKQMVFDKMSHPEIKQKIIELKQKLQDNTLSQTDLSHINTINSYFTKARLDAEKAIKKHHLPNNAEWSLILHKAYYYNQYWQALYNQQILGDDYEARIKKILSIIQIPQSKCDNNTIKINVKKSKLHLDKIRKNSFQYCEQFLIDLALAFVK